MDTESETPGGAIASGNKPGAACPVAHMNRSNGILPAKNAAIEWLENPQICPGAVAPPGISAPSGSRLRGPNQEVSNGAPRVNNPAPGTAQPSQNQPLRLNDYLTANPQAYPPPFASSSRAVNR